MRVRTAGWLLVVAAACAACGSVVVTGDGSVGSGGDTSAGTGSGPATFACGSATCHAGQTCFSSYIEGDPGPKPPPYCKDLPAPCSAHPTCDCMKQPLCGGQVAPFGKCVCDQTGCFLDCVMP